MKKCIFQVAHSASSYLNSRPQYIYMKKPNHPYFHCMKGVLDISTYEEISLVYYYGCLSDAGILLAHETASL